MKTIKIGFKYFVERPEGYQFVDENGKIIEAKKIVLEKKKPKWPKTKGECYSVLASSKVAADRAVLLGKLETLLACRDAYWKLAGDWKPDWLDDDVKKYVISCNGNYDTFGGLNYSNRILVFPTAEMRDAFYENFKELIEECKELL